jgi:hypothetical protein
LAIIENKKFKFKVFPIGLSVSALNLGIYLCGPSIVIIGIRKKF